MFDGYDPERRPPYTQDVYRIIDGKLYKTVWSVCNGYGGSISISSGPSQLVEDDYLEENYEEHSVGNNEASKCGN